jgi:hypothetical protein
VGADGPPPQVGDRIFVVSASAGAAGAVSQGFIARRVVAGIQHDAPGGAAFQAARW